LLARRDHPDLKDQRDTEVLSACRACQVPSDLQEREDHRERMAKMENRAHLELEVHREWMELLERWVTRVLLDQEECRARRASEGHQENLDRRDRQDLRENPRASTWLLSPP